MNKTAIIVIATIIILLTIVIISYRLRIPTIEEQKSILEKEVIILAYEEREIPITLKDISQYGEEFEAVLDTSTTDASIHTYVGVELKDILSKNNIDLSDKKTIILNGADGYSVAYSIEDVLEFENVYIAYMEDGKYMSFQSIIISDLFSNRRCKWLTKIEVR